jgi:hypothetical protein
MAEIAAPLTWVKPASRVDHGHYGSPQSTLQPTMNRRSIISGQMLAVGNSGLVPLDGVPGCLFGKSVLLEALTALGCSMSVCRCYLASNALT